MLGTHYEDSWINSLKAENASGVWYMYGPYELYVVSLYWIVTVLTTVGYGDFSGGTSEEFLFSIFLEFGGLLLFSLMTTLFMEYAKPESNFEKRLTDYLMKMHIWVLKLEYAANDFMPPSLFHSISIDVEIAFRHDHNLLVESANFY